MLFILKFRLQEGFEHDMIAHQQQQQQLYYVVL